MRAKAARSHREEKTLTLKIKERHFMSHSTDQSKRAEDFHRLHVKGDPINLFNVWDAGSARAVAAAGAKAIATGSWSVAAAQGYADGQALPLADALANLARI